MRPPGSFKLSRRRRAAPASVLEDPLGFSFGRAGRIVDSLREQILDRELEPSVRIRKVFEEPRAIYRIELEVPQQRCRRTTLLDEDALEELLEIDEVREVVVKGLP